MSNKLKMIPLCDLRPSKANVRKTDRLADIEQLAASIQANGLLENLVVKSLSDADKTYQVVAGARRYAALKLLSKRRKIARDHPVACLPLSANRSATEVSLAENFVRIPPHPADQFEAFAELVGQGLTIADVARRFGITTMFVEQRLKLAAVSPKLVAEYRSGAMTLEQLTAFTLSDSHALQEEVWFERGFAEMPAQSIRRMLTDTEVPSTDPRARLVGATAYEAAGGTIRRDLFDRDDEGYFSDSQLLDRLVFDKLNAAAEAVRAEGWNWVEIHSEPSATQTRTYRYATPERAELGQEEEARLSELARDYDELVAALEEGDDTRSAELDRVTAEMQKLQDKEVIWSDAQKAQAGAIVCISEQGEVAVIRGLLNPESGTDRAAPKRGEGVKHNGHGNGYAEAVVVDLSAHRTAALREVLAAQPAVALHALLHALVSRLFHPGRPSTCLRIKSDEVVLDHASASVGESKAMQSWLLRHRSWQERIPQPDQVWEWIGALGEAEQDALLAHCVSMTVDALSGRMGSSSEEAIAKLVQAVGLDMSLWWRPTCQNFLQRVTKTDILAAVSEGVSPQASWRIAGLKKDRMAKQAEKLLEGSGWIPTPLRTPSVSAEQ